MQLTLPAVIIRRVPAAPDIYGQTGWDELGLTSTVCDLQAASPADEADLDRTTIITDLRLFLPPSVTLTAWDQVDIAGTTYEVIGEPNLVTHPWRWGAPDHWEVRVRKGAG